jgi:hypothetical protein
MKRACMFACLALVLVLVAGCGESPQKRLKRGVDFAKANLKSVEKNPMASVAFSSHMEMGGDAVTYLAANMGPDVDLPHYAKAAPPQEPWTVVITEGPGPNDFTLAAYGTDLNTPLSTESITVIPMKVE